MKPTLFFLLIFWSFMACKKCKDPDSFGSSVMPMQISDTIDENAKTDTPALYKQSMEALAEAHDTTFVNLQDFSDDFVYDLKYATEDNFLKAAVYECAACYVRAATAKALLKANKDFMAKGFRIKFFDCYRPNDVQWQMWELFPNPQYVANPAKGSIHNKGGAVDITLVDASGKELDMGTSFDFFGKEAHHDYTAHPDTVLKNRTLLKQVMEKHGFWSIRTEWWHYNLTALSNAQVANFKWPCP